MINILRKVEKKDLKEHLYNIDLEDKKLYEEICKNSFGIFQFSGALASKMVEQVQPEKFDELIAVNACARPGTSSFLPEYIDNKSGNIKKYPDKVHELLNTSRGIVIYQEQIMSIFNKIGGFSLERTNYIRSLMKKLGKAKKAQQDIDAWNKEIDDFVKGAINNGINEKDAKKITEDLLQLSNYSFNRAHAYAYSYNGAETLYLATYFKQYFYASTMHFEGNKEKFKEAVKVASNVGYKILPPDVNKSMISFYPTQDKEILWALESVKGVASTSVDAIISGRSYNSILNFILKHIGNRHITKRITLALIYSGAFDDLISGERKYYGKIAELFYETKKTTKIAELLEKKWNDIENSLSLEEYKTTNNDLISYDEEYLGGNFFHSIFSNELKAKVMKKVKAESLQKLSMCEIKNAMVPLHLILRRTHIDKSSREMAFMDVEDMNGIKISFPIFASYWQSCKEKFTGDGFYFCLIYVDTDGSYKFGTTKWTNDEQKKKMLVRIE